MSSSQPFASSPLRRPSRRRSRFTYKHLSQLALSSTTCPLRVIAHVDLDAFYAQCEMVRLGLPEDQPLAVQQWQGLIAINYPARSYGLNRFANINDAKKSCPEIILQHVATWKEGDEVWQYHPDAFKNMATHKVSLDPYRRESKKILSLIKEYLPAPPIQRVEKASVDEVFLDLSAQVHSQLLERYPELQGPPPYDDPTEKLPTPPSTALDWGVDALVDLDDGETEEDDPDWDDIAILLGSEIVRGIRARVREMLKYTCSAGIGKNKMIAKLGSGHKKPNQQTIVRNRATQQFLREMKFTKIRNLGGKLGDEVVAMFNTDSVKDLLEIPLERLKRLGDDSGTWIYQTIRGEDYSEVNSRTQIKSMLSAKSFRPSINSFEQGVRWLRIFAADIFSRLVEEGVVENKRRPKTINLHHRQGAATRSKQAPIPQGKTVSEAILFDLARNLLAQVVVDGRAWPCANLSLSVGGFEDGVTNNHGIGGFLVRGDEAKAMSLAPSKDTTSSPSIEESRPAKRKRIDEVGLKRFFVKDGNKDSDRSWDEEDMIAFEDVPSAQGEGNPDFLQGRQSCSRVVVEDEEESTETGRNGDETGKAEPTHDSGPSSLAKFVCKRCHQSLPIQQEHEHHDWHFAKDIQDEEQPPFNAPKSITPDQGPPRTAEKSRKRGRGRPLSTNIERPEKGQSRLAFGS